MNALLILIPMIFMVIVVWVVWDWFNRHSDDSMDTDNLMGFGPLDEWDD